MLPLLHDAKVRSGKSALYQVPCSQDDPVFRFLLCFLLLFFCCFVFSLILWVTVGSEQVFSIFFQSNAADHSAGREKKFSVVHSGTQFLLGLKLPF